MSNQLDMVKSFTPQILEFGDHNYSLKELVEWLEDGTMQIPDYQRDFIWNERTQREYIETVLGQSSERGYGVICTYQINGNGVIWLADGRQRLETSRHFMKNPTEYGVEEDRARDALRVFRMSLQHRHYKTHDIGMSWFQKVNRGTSVIPSEYYRGLLTRSDNGKLVLELPNKTLSMVSMMIAREKKTRDQEGVRVRSCYAMFLQYIDKFKGTTFWSVGSKVVKSGTVPVEGLLRTRIDTMTRSELINTIKLFNEYNSQTIWELERCARDYGQSIKPFSLTVIHTFMHLRIYMRNNKIPMTTFSQCVEEYIKRMSGYKTFASRGAVILENGTTVDLTFTAGGLSTILRTFELVGLKVKPEKRKQGVSQRPGIHNSHIEPFAESGNGETVPEIGFLNMARGAMPMSKAERVALGVAGEQPDAAP